MSVGIDVIYALHLKPGDLYAGQILPDAPTRPVHNFAWAHKLTDVTQFKTDESTWLALTTAAGEINPVKASTQVMVIRGMS